jgi:hypothetical protein
MKVIPASVADCWVSKENEDNDEERVEVTINEQGEEEDGWNGDAESDWGDC